MHTFNLKNRVGWGNEIHIETEYGTYAGSGRCRLNKSPYGIIHKKPTLKELINGARVNGHCSTPYVKNSDILIYETDDNKEVKLKFRKVKYERNPSDMFFGELRLVSDNSSVIAQIKRVLQMARPPTQLL